MNYFRRIVEITTFVCFYVAIAEHMYMFLEAQKIIMLKCHSLTLLQRDSVKD